MGSDGEAELRLSSRNSTSNAGFKFPKKVNKLFVYCLWFSALDYVAFVVICLAVSVNKMLIILKFRELFAVYER